MFEYRVVISGAFFQGGSVTIHTPYQFVTVSELVARARVVMRAELVRGLTAMRIDGLFPRFTSDFVEALSCAHIHGIDGAPLLPEDLASSALRDGIVWLCFGVHSPAEPAKARPVAKATAPEEEKDDGADPEPGHGIDTV